MKLINRYFSISYGLNKIKLPLIHVRIRDKILCLILDIESTNYLINCNVSEYFNNIVESVGECNIAGIDAMKYDVRVISLSFTFEGQIYNPKFCVKPLLEAFSAIEKETGAHKLRGNDFMMENEWIIDFEKFKVI